MACPLCGEQCSCSYTPARPEDPAAQLRTVVADGEDYDNSEQHFLASLEAPAEFSTSDNDHGIVGSSSRTTAAVERRSSDLLSPASNWRQEVTSRVQDFRARRARRRNDDHTLTFQFEPPSPDSWDTGRSDAPAVGPAQFDYYRNLTAQAVARLDAARAAAAAQEEQNALALANAVPGTPEIEEEPVTNEEAVPHSDTAEQYFGWHDGAAVPSTEATTAYMEEPAPEGKIIEFPRPPVIIPPSSEELAEPVLDKPRILDVPEAVPTATAPLAGISLEPAEEEPFSTFQVDLPMAVASISQRLFGGLVDGALVLIASGIFFGITLQMQVPLPTGKFAAVTLTGLPFIFWLVYQYLFLVHGGATPGMKLSNLSITSFDGEPVSRQVRRWRALTMGLSALSLGLGLLWAIFDEDTLCWHDRITRTYITGESG